MRGCCARGLPPAGPGTPPRLSAHADLCCGFRGVTEGSLPIPDPGEQGGTTAHRARCCHTARSEIWVALLSHGWICREGRRVVNIVLGTPGTCLHSHPLLHPQTLSRASTGGHCSRSDGVHGSTSVPTRKAVFRFSCVPVLPQPSAAQS